MSLAQRAFGSVTRARSMLALALFTSLAVGVAALATSRSQAPPSAPSCEELSAAALRGRLIFRRGVTATGTPVRGVIGGGSAAMSGREAALTGREAACAGCHTPSGAGADEGGLAAPPITPERLFADALDRGDRSRRAHDDASLAAAVRDGWAPRGEASSTRRLGLGMPRYALERADLDDLIAYLRCLGHDRDPGVEEDRLTVGAALPLSGPMATMGVDVRNVLAASFAEVGAEGGIFRRRIDLVVEDSARGGSIDEAGATDRLVSAGVLALVGSVWSGGAAPGGGDEIPLVAPIGPLDPGASAGAPLDGEDAPIFYVHAGADALARIAVKQRAGLDGLARPRLLVAHARGRAGDAWLRGARAEARRRALAAPESLPFEPDRLDSRALIEAARRGGSNAVLLWGTATDLAAAASAIGRVPGVQIDAPGHLLDAARAALPAAARDRVLFIDPAFGGQVYGPSVVELRALLDRHGIAPRHLAAQARARVAALVLIEALKRTGARVTRDGLVAALETFRDFDAGLVPPLSYGKGRRVGVLGASILRLDAASGAPARVSAWTEIAP